MMDIRYLNLEQDNSNLVLSAHLECIGHVYVHIQSTEKQKVLHEI